MRSSDRLGGRPKDLHTHLHTHASIMSLPVCSRCLAYSRILRTAQGAWPPPMTLDHQSNLQPPDTVKVARQRWACRRPTARLGKGARLWLHCPGIRIGASGLWCWRRLLRVPWTARGSNQSILREISAGCSLVGLMLKLKLQYFGHLMRGTDSFEKTVMLGKIEGRRRRGRQRKRWLDGITDSWTRVWVNSGGWWWTGRPGVLQSMGSQGRTRLRLNWTEAASVHVRCCWRQC